MEIVEILKDAFSDRLVTVGLHNLSVSAKFGNNGLLIMLDTPHLVDFKYTKQIAKKFKKQYNTYLLLEKDFFYKNKDLYPMEILELKQNAKILFGFNPFQDLEVSTESLRNQLKREIASKILSLRGLFIELTLERKIVEDITYRSLYNFYMIGKYILYLKDEKTEKPFDELEQHFSIDLKNTKSLFYMSNRPSFNELLPLFEGYLEEINQFLTMEF